MFAFFFFIYYSATKLLKCCNFSHDLRLNPYTNIKYLIPFKSYSHLSESGHTHFDFFSTVAVMNLVQPFGNN